MILLKSELPSPRECELKANVRTKRKLPYRNEHIPLLGEHLLILLTHNHHNYQHRSTQSWNGHTEVSCNGHHHFYILERRLQMEADWNRRSTDEDVAGI